MVKPDNFPGEVRWNTEGPMLVGTVFVAEMFGHLPEATGRIAAPHGSLQAPPIRKIFLPQYEQAVWFFSTGTARGPDLQGLPGLQSLQHSRQPALRKVFKNLTIAPKARNGDSKETC